MLIMSAGGQEREMSDAKKCTLAALEAGWSLGWLHFWLFGLEERPEFAEQFKTLNEGMTQNIQGEVTRNFKAVEDECGCKVPNELYEDIWKAKAKGINDVYDGLIAILKRL